MAKPLEQTLIKAQAPASGKLDADRLTETLGLSTSQMAQILNSTDRGSESNHEEDKQDIHKLVSLIARLQYLLDGSIEHVRIWLREPHPVLGGHTPMSCLLAGKASSVELLVHAMETGQPL
ncbi:MAG: DUF2384 domain-containing protein [Hormoscilla sp. SP5CHS1]|nr:DUF2384 domain-containing protein [Hormoscilla sp. SP5CHS1]